MEVELAGGSDCLVAGIVVFLSSGMELGGGSAGMVSGVVVFLGCGMELEGSVASGRVGVGWILLVVGWSWEVGQLQVEFALTGFYWV